MKTKWIGLLSVVILAAGIIAYKVERPPQHAAEATQLAQERSSAGPEVILVANLSEANDKGDNCSEIIHLVRQAGERGVKIREFSPDSDSPLIRKYHVLTIPTVLVLEHGKVPERYEGESGATVREIRDRLTALR